MHDPVARRFGTPPSAGGGITRLACARAKEAGIELGPLLRKAGLTLQQVEDANARLSVRGQIKFLELAAEALRDEFLGFHLAGDFDLRTIGWLYYILASSDVLGEALQRAARYSALVNEGVALAYSEGPDVCLSFNYVGIARRLDRHQIEFFVTTFVRACRELTGRQVQPSRVKLTHHRQKVSSAFTALLGCEAEFGADVDEIVFSETVKRIPVVSADPYLNNLLIRYCEEALLRRQKVVAPLRLAVENAIAPLLPHGKARVEVIASRLGMSQRTLARRLAREGLNFTEIMDELRADLAKRHLEDSQLSISQIAWLVGYQEVSAFTHAFKRWTEMTPRQMRSRTRGQGEPVHSVAEKI